MMTIFLLTGTPGSGKSLHMAEIIYFRCRSDKPVLTNFEVNLDSFKRKPKHYGYIDNMDLSPKLLQDFASMYWTKIAKKPVREGELKLFIDECQVLFDARTWNDKNRKEWVRFFSQHRKMGFDVYLVAQFDGMIDKQIRALVEYEVKHRKVNNFGWFGKTVHLLALGKPVVCAVTYWYGQKMRLSSEFYVGMKRFYSIYDTLKVFDKANIV